MNKESDLHIISIRKATRDRNNYRKSKTSKEMIIYRPTLRNG